MAEAGTIGIAHHGEATDHLFKSGQIDKVADFLKRVKDAGLMAGVSTHMPAVVDTIESKGWDLGLLHDLRLPAASHEGRVGKAARARPRCLSARCISRRIRRGCTRPSSSTKRPCLAFKILAAGRLSDRREWVEQAFQQAFQSIKPGDGVIVGIYDRYTDQPSDNAALTRKFVEHNI